ncbi:SDR family NAD(P)-dependent oxidoreductase [Agrococcus baldri]|uniref:Short-chain dehydrogenase n=1 Tax=Agrococcus baldri TaxID=153730 RepID=A0AA87US86_9MICO|nr:SDR family NAD(P)-dependent oxidoreductase [Agrococcus baldri]GEK80623.1 short-chain dehydrogenase [Agrococcus baldri]
MTRTIVLTGASDGIGAAAARQLARHGHRLLLVGRSAERTAAISDELGAERFLADFTSLDQVAGLADELRAATDRIDVLANNAGGIFGRRTVTADGNEQTFQVNHLAGFLLTQLLLPQLRAGDGIVVNTSSSAARLLARFDIDDLGAEHSYSPNRAYGNAKLANILHARGLLARYGATGIHPVAFDPGNVRTGFAGSGSILRLVYRTPLARLILISAEQGGATLRHFVDGTPGSTWQEGAFYAETRLATAAETNPLVHADVLVDLLWERSEALVAPWLPPWMTTGAR